MFPSCSQYFFCVESTFLYIWLFGGLSALGWLISEFQGSTDRQGLSAYLPFPSVGFGNPMDLTIRVEPNHPQFKCCPVFLDYRVFVCLRRPQIDQFVGILGRRDHDESDLLRIKLLFWPTATHSYFKLFCNLLQEARRCTWNLTPESFQQEIHITLVTLRLKLNLPERSTSNPNLPPQKLLPLGAFYFYLQLVRSEIPGHQDPLLSLSTSSEGTWPPRHLGLEPYPLWIHIPSQKVFGPPSLPK